MKKIMKMIEEDGRLLEVHSYPTMVFLPLLFSLTHSLQISIGIFKVCTGGDTND